MLSLGQLIAKASSDGVAASGGGEMSKPFAIGRLAPCPQSRKRPAATRARGFTLIELMVVVLIVAILAAIALPSYRKHMLRANRAAAVSFMYQVASAQERFMTDNRSFSSSLSTLNEPVPSNVSANYTVATAGSVGPPPSYTITATPISGQRSDTDCGTLTLNGDGSRSPTTASCWK
jgi:type IV pilus assembly protein PilE